MPRRTLTPATPASSAPPVVPPRDPSLLAQSDPEWAANLHLLRRQWKWAAFSQFFYTFAPLLAMSDVALSDIEDDLARSTAIYLPRVMQRLLYTLTQDRKITIDTWQTGLRKQYMRRDPPANPIGPEPPAPSRHPSSIPEQTEEEYANDDSIAEPSGDVVAVDSTKEAGQNPAGAADISKATSEQPVKPEGLNLESVPPTPSVKKEASPEPEADEQEESKDWLELPMLTKLDSLHLVTEWQFQNPHRLRTIMKDDDEGAQWRIEPVGYDAKTNAYWLIGPDRLWIQRVPPKPPKGVKRKRTTTAKKVATVASTSKEEPEANDSDSPRSAKRKRAPPRASTSRASRSRIQQSTEQPQASGSKTTRAAKLQANKKLDAQAKELAEYQRQAALAARSSSRSHKKGGSQASPAKLSPRGTRTSARLRGSTAKNDDEWQEIPDEWLHETADSDAKTPVKKGKGKEVRVQSEKEKEDEPSEDAELLRTGLESDADSSVLTELSDDVDGRHESSAPEETQPQPNGKSKSGRKTRSTNAKGAATAAEAVASIDTGAEELEAPPEEKPWIPADFIEWETICVTLHEWEHISERFEKSNHYLERALFKVLSQQIVPAVTAELKEANRKRQMEDAIVHRKRSSRIAMKESEKEEARIAAQKKAEEAEKMARAKRVEARARREEAEREKRELAREQRREEREERERRATEKQEGDESASIDVIDRGSSRSSKASVANGTHSTGSVQLSRVATPSGVRSPDWILDCEICHKSGINLDDGLPMVSCGLCNKWQHITCHDLADQHAGRPRRNWEVQQFYCRACRQRHANTNGLSHGTHQQSYTQAQQQYPWTQAAAADAVHLQKTGSSSYSRDPYAQSTSDLRFLPRQAVENGTSYGQQVYPQKGVPAQSAYARQQQATPALTFAHYQPEQRMFSTSRTPHAVQIPPAWPSRPSSADNMGYAQPQPVSPAVHQSAQFSPQYSQPQYSQSSGSYLNNRIPAAYAPSPIPQRQLSYGAGMESALPASNGTNGAWNAGSNGYHSPSASATQAAAESLAFMQELASGRSAGWQQPTNFQARTNGDLSGSYGHQNVHPDHHGMGATPQYHYSSSS
ncbi:predicted protein [Sparassis crispa]|uniref:Zinc finger PHD-type domain-containing protein n=1 Tax=Sparassis crispa TaxID=139825 RepID=A0A401H1X0_9APHY|nr:predicted protein [Sparassis crispa]GBE88446.1 predicted protein [Sparassis crispa]